jgi:23S rRNA (guanosine2251-2'-O)-methyltransferase
VELKLLLQLKRQMPLFISLNEPVAIIMGSEDRGVNPSVLKIVDEKPNYQCLEPLVLNVSVAFLYEALRQRR